MRTARWPDSFVNLSLLRMAALLVPRPERAEWLAEWRAELWYVEGSRLGFCLGAFRDAFWFRQNTPAATRKSLVESPVRCIVVLASLAAVSVFFAFRLPFPRSLLLPSPYRNVPDLALISVTGESTVDTPTVPLEQFRRLENLVPYRFTGLAFYTPLRESKRYSIAMASENLFEVLQIRTPAARTKGIPQLILTRAAWRSRGEPRTVQIAGQTAEVAGFLPETDGRLPGGFDGWLLVDQEHIAALPPETRGFVLGQSRTHRAEPRWRISLPNQQGLYDYLDCSSLVPERFLLGYGFMIAVALLIVSATTTMSLGEYPAAPLHRRWIFLAAKIALLLPLVCCGTLDVAPLISRAFHAHGLFIGSVLALRWAIVDQRRRCPVCLRILTSPARIGQPSQIFLEWYGTEFICEQGHGLLHVAENPTISFSPQRWFYLDPSWQSLFHHTGRQNTL